VRVKRCGKSAPATGVTRSARQTPSGARPNRERVVRPWILLGWPHRWMVTHPDPRKGPVDRTPPIGRLTVTHNERHRGQVDQTEAFAEVAGFWRAFGPRR